MPEGTPPAANEPAEIVIQDDKMYDIPGLGKMLGKDVKAGHMMERDYRVKTSEIAKIKTEKETLENFANTFFAFSQAKPEVYNEFLKFHEQGGQLPPNPQTPPGLPANPNAQANGSQNPPNPATPPPGNQTGRRVEYDQAVEDIKRMKQEQARLQVDRAIEELSAETGLPVEVIDKEILPLAVENHVNGKSALDNLRMQHRVWAFDKQRVEGQTEGAQRIQERLKGRFYGGTGTPAAGSKTDAELLIDFIGGASSKNDRQRTLLRGA